jgi:hypothetical protein
MTEEDVKYSLEELSCSESSPSDMILIRDVWPVEVAAPMSGLSVESVRSGKSWEASWYIATSVRSIQTRGEEVEKQKYLEVEGWLKRC